MGRKKIIEDIAKYNAEFKKNNYDDLKIRVKKGKKALIQDAAKEQGKTLNKFVNEAIDEKMERN